MSNQSHFLSLLLITGLAAFVPLLATSLRRLRLPIVVGEILAGIVVGNSGLGLIETSPTLDFLALFGFTYLMFVSGLEVDFGALTGAGEEEESALRRRLRHPVVVGGAVFALTLAMAYAAAGGLGRAGLVGAPVMIALILSTTSLGIVVPVLKERALLASPFGQSLLVAALVADFGTLVLITVQVAVHSRGFTVNLLVVLLLLVVFAAVFRLLKLATGYPRLRRLIEELSHATAQIQVRGAFALMIAFIVLSEWLGLEVILGAFLAGVLISVLSQQDRTQFLRLKIDAIGFGFFIPIFFIMVGVKFDLPALLGSLEALLLAPLLLAIAYLIKFAAAIVFRLAFSWRETIAAGALLSARLSLIIAASAIALELGLVSEAVNAAVILVAVVSCTLSPLLFNRILHKRGAPDAPRHGVIITGLGEIPVLLAERLHASGRTVTLVGDDKGQLRRLRGRDLPLVKGNPAGRRALTNAGAKTAETLIAVSTYDENNLAACSLGKEVYGIPHLIAQASDPDIASQLADLGARVVQPQLATALALEGALYFPAVFDILANPSGGVEVREARVRNAKLYGELLRNVRLPGKTLVMGVRRRGEVLIPHGDTKLRQNDLVMLVGERDAVEKSIRMLAG